MNPIIDAEKLQNVQFIKKKRQFICSNIECKTEINFEMTDEEFNNRFYFDKKLCCPICGTHIMYYYGSV